MHKLPSACSSVIWAVSAFFAGAPAELGLTARLEFFLHVRRTRYFIFVRVATKFVR